MKRSGFSEESKRKSREKALAKQRAKPRKSLNRKRTTPKDRGRDHNGQPHDIIAQAAIDAHRAFQTAARRQPCCARCGKTKGPWHPHHVVERQWLIDNHHPPDDADNALRLCVHCHSNHHGGVVRLKLKLGCLRAENLAYAFRVMGGYAPYYLRARYRGQDPRLDELELQHG